LDLLPPALGIERPPPIANPGAMPPALDIPPICGMPGGPIIPIELPIMGLPGIPMLIPPGAPI